MTPEYGFTICSPQEDRRFVARGGSRQKAGGQPFGEGGAGWLAYALHRMDFEFEDRFRDLMKLKPSEYWRRQCRATFQFDPIGAKLIEDIGVETIMWGSDYPHTDGVWPESQKYIDEQFAGLPADVV